jgi:hypothetical protein
MRDALFIVIGILLANISYSLPAWLVDKKVLMNYVPWAPLYFSVLLLLILLCRKPLLRMAKKILPAGFTKWFKEVFIDEEKPTKS